MYNTHITLNIAPTENVFKVRKESNTFRSGYSNSGNGSIANWSHEHKREIARRRRQATRFFMKKANIA